MNQSNKVGLQMMHLLEVILSEYTDGGMKLVSVGPMYGYFPNPTKSWLIVNCVDHASALFQNAGISITADGKRHLGAALGSRQFVEEYVQKGVDGWVKEIDRLSSFAVSHPHAAYVAFTHGLSNK